MFQTNSRVVDGARKCLMLAIPLLALAAPVAAKGEEGHWSYEGDAGPTHWGDLSPEFAPCASGKEQSPVDVPASAPTDAEVVAFDYAPSAVNIVNNGHTIQVNYDAGSTIVLEGKTYELAQFHFHAPSEHQLANASSPMELHLVHKAADGELAVVGVMVESGAESAALAPAWAHLPATEGEPATIPGAAVDATGFLPSDRAYYRYEGSLTTPPCTEGVNWVLMKNPIQASEAQLAAFSGIIHANARPEQPLWDRQFLTAAPSTASTVPAMLPATGAPGLPIGTLLAAAGAALAAAGAFRRRTRG